MFVGHCLGKQRREGLKNSRENCRRSLKSFSIACLRLLDIFKSITSRSNEPVRYLNFTIELNTSNTALLNFGQQDALGVEQT